MAKKTSSSRRRSRPVTKKKKMPDKNLMILAGIVVVIVIAVAGFLILSGGTNNDENINSDDQANGEENPVAIFNTTKGIIEVELFANQTPKTVENFVKLANGGFYDGMIFHRISDDFMIQAGRSYPDGTVKSSPYGNIEEFEGSVSHVDGAISMASTASGVPGSAEFFICDGAQPFLDGKYAAFGVVISGKDVVRDIADEEHDGSFEPQPGGGKPLEDIIINSITIEN